MTEEMGRNLELVAAVQRGDNADTLRKMARALAPREPEKQVEALVYLQIDLAPARVELKAELAAIMRDAAVVKGRLAELDKVENWADEIILATMVEREIKKVDMSHATVTLMDGKESMQVSDIGAVQDQYARFEKKGDKRAAMRCLRDTGVVPSGFEFVRGEPFITKRGKK